MSDKPENHDDDRITTRTRARLQKPVSRRGFLQRAAGVAAAAATPTAVSAVAAATGATAGTGCSTSWSQYFQDHYKEMDAEDKERVFARIARQTEKRHGRAVNVSDAQPIDGVSFAFCISLSLCNGNRQCVYACAAENNQSRDPAIHYIKVVELDRGTFNLETGDAYYEGEAVPKKDKVYLPMQCNQCDNPPCVKACPVEATWKEKDGIVVIDYDWCIGCRYCMAACPYEARRFNFHEPQIPRSEINPDQGYLSNRIRPKGVVEKCHFCLHRTRNGHYPACLEACPTGARKFGDLADPDSEVSAILREKRVFVLKEELQTIPRVYYFFD